MGRRAPGGALLCIRPREAPMTFADPLEAPQPGSFATAPIDKLAVSWQSAPADFADETPADFFARRLVARAINGARSEGLDVRDVITALGKRLTVAAGVLGKAPFSEADIRSFLATIPASEPGA
ncbi:hypothetical protein SEA_BARNSTORMER_75 [Microbacterium phage Barnstormer]|uniref:Uncharacterized protein n=1 Tax=Microbacterium phage Barnstormer TaxID=3028491 RepID=A0AAF0CJZ6_9CAUD|nr:hypothetical protein SEA_BARNSTORMER_75 [Microbacterium phage Barnstormer]WDS52181.1 hypothetical protein SEA_UTZCHIPS_75 [Microbacterium phage UtzChips]